MRLWIIVIFWFLLFLILKKIHHGRLRCFNREGKIFLRKNVFWRVVSTLQQCHEIENFFQLPVSLMFLNHIGEGLESLGVITGKYYLGKKLICESKNFNMENKGQN